MEGDMDWHLIKNDPTYEINRLLAHEVVQNNPEAVNFYLKNIGFPIIRHIESSITHYDITAEYYMFLSYPYDTEQERACWHRVELYKGINCLLSTYTSNISCRHFCKEVNKEKKKKAKEGDLLEFVDYESLLRCEETPDDSDNIQIRCVREAYKMLNERDRMVLQCLIIKNMSALEAFPVLAPFISPRPKEGLTSEEVKMSWTNKQRQDAMSLLKGRALDRLQINFKQNTKKL